MPKDRVSGPDDGWTLKQPSWAFHRGYYARFGRCMAYGEYTRLLRQIRASSPGRLARSVWRVTLPPEAGGGEIIVMAKTGRRSSRGLFTLLPDDWMPPEEAPPAAGPLRLTLPGKIGKLALEARLRQFGVRP